MDFPKNIPANFASRPRADSALRPQTRAAPAVFPLFSNCFPALLPPTEVRKIFTSFATRARESGDCEMRPWKVWRNRKNSSPFFPLRFSAIFIPSFKKILRLHSRHIAQYGFRKTQRNWKNPPQNFSPHNFFGNLCPAGGGCAAVHLLPRRRAARKPPDKFSAP